MSHLSAERLAALAEAGEVARPHEAEHLAACPECARERAAYLALLSAARAERFTVGAPLTRWEAIASAMRGEEGHAPVARHRDAAMRIADVRIADVPVADIAARRRVFTVATRAAAAVLLLAGGVMAGRLSAVAGPLAVAGAVDDTPSWRIVPGAVREVSDQDGRGAWGFRSVADAQAALAQHEEGYQRAVAYLAENDTTAWLAAPDGYRTRLVALERAGRTIREAMEEAPYDPVLSGYYLTTLGQREATLRQLNVAVPAGARLNTF